MTGIHSSLAIWLDNPLYDEDWMEDYLAVGCKYCGCYTFKEKQC